VKPFAILVIDLVGCLASLGLIMLWPESDIVLWISSIGLGLFMASVFPTILLLAGERMQVTGVMTGWFLAGASLGAMFLPWGIGQAFARYGAGAMPVLVFLTIAANLLVILLFLSRPTVESQSVQS
jgi:fucose permease